MRKKGDGHAGKIRKGETMGGDALELLKLKEVQVKHSNNTKRYFFAGKILLPQTGDRSVTANAAHAYCLFCKASRWHMKNFALTIFRYLRVFLLFLAMCTGMPNPIFSKRNYIEIIILTDFRSHCGKRRCLNFRPSRN
jgi:hypothetical protein